MTMDILSRLQRDPHVLALDLGLAATGVAFPDGSSDVWDAPVAGYWRHEWARRAIHVWVAEWRPDLVVLEGYAWSRDGRQAILPAELGGVVRTALTVCRVPWATIDPMSVKLWATGNGSATKDDMVAAVNAWPSVWPAVEDHNEADAVALRLAVLSALGADVPEPDHDRVIANEEKIRRQIAEGWAAPEGRPA